MAPLDEHIDVFVDPLPLQLLVVPDPLHELSAPAVHVLVPEPVHELDAPPEQLFAEVDPAHMSDDDVVHSSVDPASVHVFLAPLVHVLLPPSAVHELVAPPKHASVAPAPRQVSSCVVRQRLNDPVPSHVFWDPRVHTSDSKPPLHRLP